MGKGSESEFISDAFLGCRAVSLPLHSAAVVFVNRSCQEGPTVLPENREGTVSQSGWRREPCAGVRDERRAFKGPLCVLLESSFSFL